MKEFSGYFKVEHMEGGMDEEKQLEKDLKSIKSTNSDCGGSYFPTSIAEIAAYLISQGYSKSKPIEGLVPLKLAQHIARELYGKELEQLRNEGHNYTWCVILGNSICEKFGQPDKPVAREMELASALDGLLKHCTIAFDRNEQWGVDGIRTWKSNGFMDAVKTAQAAHNKAQGGA